MTRLSNTKTQSKWSHISNDIIRAYSIPLILGVIVALIVANAAPHWYEYWIEEHLFFGKFTFAWFVENVFMVFFFGTAGIEIVHALSPGGALNPIKKAVTPLMATLGGVLGPAVLFLLLHWHGFSRSWSSARTILPSASCSCWLSPMTPSALPSSPSSTRRPDSRSARSSCCWSWPACWSRSCSGN